jgi:hypothetical protein
LALHFAQSGHHPVWPRLNGGQRHPGVIPKKGKREKLNPLGREWAKWYIINFDFFVLNVRLGKESCDGYRFAG